MSIKNKVYTNRHKAQIYNNRREKRKGNNLHSYAKRICIKVDRKKLF